MSDAREVIAEQLGEHRYVDPRLRCACGWSNDRNTHGGHPLHVADAILSALTEAGIFVGQLERVGHFGADIVIDDAVLYEAAEFDLYRIVS